LTTGQEPFELIGSEIEIAKDIPADLSSFTGVTVRAGDGKIWITFDTDQALHVDSALRALHEVEEAIGCPPDGGWRPETRLVLDEHIAGTADVLGWFPAIERVVVLDMKTGRNAVDVEETPQLRLYALAAAKVFEAKEAQIVVSQRQGGHRRGRGLVFSIDELRAWYDIEVRPAAMRAVEARAANDIEPYLSVGAHCRYCPAIAICPAYRRFAMEFEPKPVKSLSPEELSELLDKATAIEEYRNLLVAEAVGRMRSGAEIPHYTLVNRRGTRHWTKAGENKLVEVLGEQAYRRVILTPSQVEDSYPEHAVLTRDTDYVTYCNSSAYPKRLSEQAKEVKVRKGAEGLLQSIRKGS